jgi:hypothetical protein
MISDATALEVFLGKAERAGRVRNLDLVWRMVRTNGGVINLLLLLLRVGLDLDRVVLVWLLLLVWLIPSPPWVYS